MTTANYQKFQFLPPDEVDFRKKMRVAVIIFFIYIALFIASRQIRSGDSLSAEFFSSLFSMFPGFFVYGTYAAWQNFKDRQYQVSHGHIEIDGLKLRIFTGKVTPFDINFQDIEKVKKADVYLSVTYREKKKLKDKLILLLDVERADDFVAIIKQRVAAAK